MKNAPSSITGRFSEINLELQKINKKFAQIDSSNEKFEGMLNEETKYRQNIEKKTFLMYENFNEKFNSLRSGLDELGQCVAENMENIKFKVLDDVQKGNDNVLRKFEESFKRIESNEKSSSNSQNELNLFKNEVTGKILRIEEMIHNELKQVMGEIKSNQVKNDIIEKKLNEQFLYFKDEMGKLNKEVTVIKNEIELLKNFKDNTVKRFKEIDEEFISHEDAMTKFSSKNSLMIQEIEGKLKHYEVSFSMFNDNFANIKKDIYAQIYDVNMTVNTKMQKLNETLLHDMQTSRTELSQLEKNIVNENEKFIGYVEDKISQQSSNFKKMLEYSNEDVDLLKSKCQSLEDITKNLRSEFFNNLNEVEEFLTKKYEAVFRTLNSERR